jgi:hypothetical protein
MEENLNEIREAEENTGFSAWLDNFWYHYKWHTIIALFVVFVVTICTLQMCRKEESDVYVLYGGGKYISRQVEDGNFCEFDVITSSFKNITKDYDEDGKIKPLFYNIYLLSDSEIKAAGDDVNHSVLYQNNQEFRELMYSSPYYICLLSDELYLEYSKTEGVFVPLAPYTNGLELEFLDGGAVYLHSENLPFNKLPGICDLPENTVICLKSKTAFTTNFGGKSSAQHFERSEESLRALFNYGR